jgi:hypothetical protein
MFLLANFKGLKNMYASIYNKDFFKWKYLFFNKNKIYIVFIGVFCFFRGRWKLTHVVFHFFLPFLFFGPNHSFSRIPLFSFDRYIIEAFAKKFHHASILACFEEWMAKTRSLKTFFQIEYIILTNFTVVIKVLG